MTFIPTQSGFMRLEDSEKLLRAIFPNYPSPKPRYPAPALEAIAHTEQIGGSGHVLHHC
jgi:hypothetical protein